MQNNEPRLVHKSNLIEVHLHYFQNILELKKIPNKLNDRRSGIIFSIFQ